MAVAESYIHQLIADLGTSMGSEMEARLNAAVPPISRRSSPTERKEHFRERMLALEKIKKEATRPEAIQQRLQSESDRKNAIVTELVEIGEPAVLPLIAALDTPFARMYAIQALARIGDERAIEPLLALVKPGSPVGITFPIRALADLRASRAVDPLIAILNDPTPYLHRERPAQLKTRDKVLIRIIFGIVDVLFMRRLPYNRHKDMDGYKYDPVCEAQMYRQILLHTVLEAIGDLGDKRALPALAKYLADKDERVRKMALDAIDKLEPGLGVPLNP